MSDAVQRAPYAVTPPRYSVSHQMVTTAFDLPNYRILQNLGVLRGIVVRSRNIFATLGATLHMSDAAENTTRPVTKTRFRPSRSAIEPANISRLASTTV